MNTKATMSPASVNNRNRAVASIASLMWSIKHSESPRVCLDEKFDFLQTVYLGYFGSSLPDEVKLMLASNYCLNAMECHFIDEFQLAAMEPSFDPVGWWWSDDA